MLSYAAVVKVCSRSKMRIVSLLSLLWSLVEVHCQPAPYVTFMGQTLASHSYVDLSQVGRPEDGGPVLMCHTDLATCCRPTEGIHRGDWYFPDGTTRLPFPGDGDIFEARLAQRVDVRVTNNANSPTGIYHCDIATVAVHDEIESVRETVYMGLYTGSGGKLN